MDSIVFNLNLFTVGLVTVISVILGIIVYIRNIRSITNISFALFVLVTVVWGGVNYLSYSIINPQIILWLLRLVLFFAVWQAFFIFQFFYVYPNYRIDFSKYYKFLLFPVVSLVSVLTLTPFILKEINGVLITGGATSVTNGPGIIFFGLLNIGLVASAIYILIKKIKKLKTKEILPLRLILTGTVLTFSLIIIFNFIFPAFLNNPTYTALGAVFFFPFIVFTAYAILKHHLLNIKVVATEILVFVLAFSSLAEVFFTNNINVIVLRLIIFNALLFVGFFLIKSVRKEVEQREKLEKLTADLQAANERLKQLDEAKTEFLSITSHQLRTPLSAIKGYLSMLQEGDFGKLSKKQADIVGVLLRNSERLIRLINIFLNISRIESGRLKINKSLTDINQLVRDIVKSLAIEAATKHIKVEFKENDIPLFQFDSDKMTDVIMNLVDNAIKYTPIGGWVSVSVKNMDKYILVKVQDNGKGISYDELDQLFQKFRRGKDINRVDTSGVGLGLYIAKKIIEGHGGNIWAESEGENKGTTFKFTLPLE